MQSDATITQNALAPAQRWRLPLSSAMEPLPEGYRFAEEKDFPRLTEIWTEAFPGDRDADAQAFFAIYYNKERILVFEPDGRIVTMCSLFQIELNEGPALYLYALATDAAYRGRGIGKNLLALLYKRYGMPLLVDPEHTGVERFYQNYGFTPIAEEELLKIAERNGILNLLLDPPGEGYILR